jgi:hypothetical protein
LGFGFAQKVANEFVSFWQSGSFKEQIRKKLRIKQVDAFSQTLMILKSYKIYWIIVEIIREPIWKRMAKLAVLLIFITIFGI